MKATESSREATAVPALTLGETADTLRDALRDYVEAAYHISHPALVGERRELLNQPGVISQIPYVESTPRYKTGKKFLDTPGLRSDVGQLFKSLSEPAEVGGVTLPKRLFDPPYTHQQKAIETTLVSHRDLVVMTGTGSGKTESFLIPILGKLASEAISHPKRFEKQCGVRALVLYPMNALVNDQLARMRLLFADPRVTQFFQSHTGRPPRFARYTSRTPYAGVRTSKKDQVRLRFIENYYLKKLEERTGSEWLPGTLMEGGRWPAKPDLRQWFGAKYSPWLDAAGEFLRCTTQPGDSELITRHEVLAQPPDILITNYSMLEYMMLRPLEKSVFERTKEWLASSEESFLLVLDEAHLYRGAPGAEVGHLIRRLRTRLGIPPERLQVIGTSASFASPSEAQRFAAQLAGKNADDFDVVVGDLAFRSPDGPADPELVDHLNELDLPAFFMADSSAKRKELLAPLLGALGVSEDEIAEMSLEQGAHLAVDSLPAMGNLVNRTMTEALPVMTLERELFPGAPPEVAAKALLVLMTLGTLARKSGDGPPVLPCRLHVFFRGLPGLWACMDPECTEVDEVHRHATRPCGKLYAQARELCGCGSRVLEFFTCRHCGTAYARAYTDDVESPTYLWPQPGDRFTDDEGVIPQLHPIDLLLQDPREDAEVADYDLQTGRLNAASARLRTVYLPLNRLEADAQADLDESRPQGAFRPCGVCADDARYGRSSVQDHQTKGDQPFQALISRQLHVQAPAAREATAFAPLRGRKVLIFSDSRQMAARIAPTLQEYSLRDVIRPLVIAGLSRLGRIPQLTRRLTLDDAYFAAILAATELGVRLRPALRQNEGFGLREVMRTAQADGTLDDDAELADLFDNERSEVPPDALLFALRRGLFDASLGLQPLALASLRPAARHDRHVTALPNLGPISSNEDKIALVGIWLTQFVDSSGVRFQAMDGGWQDTRRGFRLHKHGMFTRFKKFLGDKTIIAGFTDDWLPVLRERFTETRSQKYCLRASRITLDLSDGWAVCRVCRRVQREFSMLQRCQYCHSDEPGDVSHMDPARDAVFTARKGHYRKPAVDALSGFPPVALIAAEHTAQIGSAQAQDVYSKAEENELLFQDIDLDGDGPNPRPAIDVLSCTTTMEVGIDIGSLSGVALRNMPPRRANYQQRAGRAGRRGTAIATVLSMASSDSHDSHVFESPDQMIRGQVKDPQLTMNNEDISRRHVTAYLLQRYFSDRLGDESSTETSSLFAVLGKVDDFLDETAPPNRSDFQSWLSDNQMVLGSEVRAWLPTELGPDTMRRLTENLALTTIREIDRALDLDEHEHLAGDADAGAPALTATEEKRDD